MIQKPQHYDSIIIGGGLVGLTSALALAAKGLSVAIVERRGFKDISAATSDGRASAIARGSELFLESLGVWRDLKPYAGKMHDIRVSDSQSKCFLHYDHTLVGDAPVGSMVENHVMLKTLVKHAEDSANITLYDHTNYTETHRHNTHVEVMLEGGKVLSAQLLIAADGRYSSLREQAGIKVLEHRYRQCGIVCNVEHKKPHDTIAQERFLPSGPFAVLPLKNPHHSSLVWTEKEHLTPTYMAMDDAAFNEQIHKRFGGFLGEVKTISKRFSYPLHLMLAERYTDQRLILIGDAAHGIHPLAGQGFNLGIRDCEKLSELLHKPHQNGLDIGVSSVVSDYNDLRYFDALSLVAITHGLNSLFCSDALPVKLARRLGMASLEQIPTVKAFLMRHAMGL